MLRCIFCFDPLDDTPGANHGKVPSEEHVVPNALGGSRDFSTMDVCRTCNSTLGDTVDAAFINSPIVAMLRHQFQTAGYSGTVPDIVLPTRSMDTGEPGRMIFRPDSTVTIRHDPAVIRDKKGDHEEILVAGHPEDVERILKGIVSKALANATPEQKTAASSALQKGVAEAVPELSELYKVPIHVDLDALHRSLVKIAYEFAHVLFGWKWTDSADAVPLRNVAKGLGSKVDIDPILQEIQVGFRRKLPLSDAAATDHHVVAFLPGSPSMVFVSLFGEPLLTAGIKLRADLDKLCGEMRADQGMMVSIDPRTRKTTWVSIADFTAHMAR